MEKLFSEFKSTSKSQWLEKVAQDLKGKSIDSLNWGFDDFTLTPFYHSQDSEYSQIPDDSQDNTWLISEIITSNNNYKKANQEAIIALNGGCTSLTFTFQGQPNSIELNQLLDGVELEYIYTEYVVDYQNPIAFSKLLKDYIDSSKYDIKKIKGSITIDGSNLEKHDILNGILPDFHIFQINADDVLITDELASILHQFNNILSSSNLMNVANYIKIKTQTDDNYFGNIAKFRALKLLLSNVLMAYNIQNCFPFIDVAISPKNNLGENNYGIIQANTQAMAAVIGGADRITVIAQEESPFAKRIARNINHLMQLESYMSRVKDVGSGSYFIEHLTDQICKVAWKKFQGKEEKKFSDRANGNIITS